MHDLKDHQENYIEELEAENDRLRDFAVEVLQWSEAYPVSVFSEPRAQKIQDVCEALGLTLDGVSAWVLRAYTKPWGDRARSALGLITKEEVE